VCASAHSWCSHQVRLSNVTFSWLRRTLTSVTECSQDRCRRLEAAVAVLCRQFGITELAGPTVPRLFPPVDSPDSPSLPSHVRTFGLIPSLTAQTVQSCDVVLCVCSDTCPTCCGLRVGVYHPPELPLADSAGSCLLNSVHSALCDAVCAVGQAQLA
jgi:hypothetical protein